MVEEAKEKAKKKAEKAAKKAEKEAKKARKAEKEAKQLAKLKGEDGGDAKEKGDEEAEDEDAVMYGAPDDHAWTDTSAALKDADKNKKDDGPDLSVSVYTTFGINYHQALCYPTRLTCFWITSLFMALMGRNLATKRGKSSSKLGKQQHVQPNTKSRPPKPLQKVLNLHALKQQLTKMTRNGKTAWISIFPVLQSVPPVRFYSRMLSSTSPTEGDTDLLAQTEKERVPY